MNNSELIINASEVTRSYHIGSTELKVLCGVNYQVPRGKWACLLGASGSGKTTLLNILGALEKPSTGTIKVGGVELSTLSRRNAARFRNSFIGFVFQAYHLLPELSILENVMLPGLFAGNSKYSVYKKAERLLSKVGLSKRLKHRPSELSGGEQQRTSIARALINDPKLLLADEPTGNLDIVTGNGILDLFCELRDDNPDCTIVMITHNQDIAALADQVDKLSDGRLYSV